MRNSKWSIFISLKTKLFVSILFLNGILTVQSQSILSGSILNADSIPIPNASILLHSLSSPDKPLVNFTTSDTKGFYSLEIDSFLPFYMLTVKATSFKTVEKKLEFSTNSINLQQNFVLLSSVSYLDTVKVDIKVHLSKTGDTITFNPDAFALKNEITVEDLLSRLPGIEIKDDGKILFNGKAVSSVLIDGDDLFKKNYPLLTQNAAPKIIDRIQVIKNYQKDQLLKEFNQPGSQVINLKLKDQFKNYLFGHGALGYGNEGNKLGDLFLIKLSPKTKIQAGVNYNTTGATYASDNKLNPEDFARNENSFFSFEQANPLLTISRYFFQNIPMHYQEHNESIQGHTNALFKKNKWESALNAKFATDKLRESQETRSTYQDGTNLFTNNMGAIKNQLQEYNLTSIKSSKNESIYYNVSLQSKTRDYGLQTASNQSLVSRQQLGGNNLKGQLNLSYNKKLKEGFLWSNTFGYFNQTINEKLQTNPDFLFWLYPDDLSLNLLTSKTNLRLEYIKLKSSLLFKSQRMTNEIGLTYSAENRIFTSKLQSKNLEDESIQIPFRNDSHLKNPFLVLQYNGSLIISEKRRITLKLYNEPHFSNYRLHSTKSRKTSLFYDYSVGIANKMRTSNLGMTIGTKRQAPTHTLFFPDFVQTSFHRIQEGHLDKTGKKSLYLQANYNLFSVKMGWVAFLLLNLSHDKSDFITNLETKGIATLSSFSDYPNSTNQLFFVFNSQKTMGEWPFSLNSNILYNRQSRFDSFNSKISKSDFQFFNGTIGFKSLFKSSVNFDYNFSWLNSKNIIKSPDRSTSSTKTLLNKLNLYVTSKKLFNSTLTVNSMVSNNGSFQGIFSDLKFNKKVWKEKLLIEMNLRNILNKKFIGNTTITPFYTQENMVAIRGAEFFFTIRYEIR
ncbi:MAG: carboxypeptidase-like regulatory domain-containing protein [Ginsengibacter sp.]